MDENRWHDMIKVYRQWTAWEKEYAIVMKWLDQVVQVSKWDHAVVINVAGFLMVLMKGAKAFHL